MVFEKEIDEMNIVFDYRNQYTIARVPKTYKDAEEFALALVYYLKTYVAKKLNIEWWKVVLIAISKNNKVVVLSDDSRSRNWLWIHFHQPSLGAAQFYDNVKPELIIEKMDALFSR